MNSTNILISILFILLILYIILLYNLKKNEQFEELKPLNYKVIFTGTARSCANELPNVLKNINILSSLFIGPNLFIVFENDSDDNTLDILNNFNFNGQKIILSEKGISDKFKFRTEKIAYARNKVIFEVNKYKGYDFIINLDLDNVNKFIDIQEFYNCFIKNDLDWSVITASQKTYYDYWALRTKDFDINIHMNGPWINDKNITLKDCENYYKSFNNNNYNYKEVLSAFGGLAIYKYKAINNCLYDSNNGSDCEHVLFHKCIRDKNNGHIFINPLLLNSGHYD